MDLMSSTNPTTAMNSAAAKIAGGMLRAGTVA